jgi:PAS domain S-box-containing protein
MDYSKLTKTELIKLLEENEKKLDKREQLFRELVNASSDGYWDWHIQDDYEYMSPRFWEIFGIDYKKKKHKPSEWQDLIHPEDLKIALENFTKHCETKGKHPYLQYARYKHADGSWVTVLCRGKVVEWDSDGNAVRMIGSHTDVTELKKIEKKLQTQNKFVLGVINSLSHPLYVINAKTCEIELENDAFKKDRPTKNETLNHIMTGKWLQDDSNVYFSPLKKTIESKQPLVFIHEHYNEKKEKRFIDLHCHPVFDSNGDVSSVIGYFIDNTEIKNLLETEKRSHAWLDHSPVCTKVVDLDFNLQFMSRAGIDALNVSDISTLYGKPYPFDFYPDSFKNVMNKNLVNVKKTGVVTTQEAPVVDVDGNELWFHSTLVPLNDNNGEIVNILIVSIETTLQHKAQKEREQLYNQVRKYNDDLKRLLYISSHDLRTPLVNIDGFANDLVDEIKVFIDKIRFSKDVTDLKNEINDFEGNILKKNVGFISASVKDMEKFIQGLLKLSKLGGKEIEKIEVNLYEMLLDIEKYQKEASHKTFDMIIDKVPNYCGDEFLLGTIFRNLISNALKNLDPKRKGEIRISYEENSTHRIYKVSDNGIGIAGKYREKIFDFFYRIPHRNYSNGVGVGLSLVKWAAHRLEGSISIESKIDEGSTFYLTLPKANKSN